METKYTREYAEKLAKENVIYGESIGNYVFGYMKAIEETAAPDLLNALDDVYRNTLCQLIATCDNSWDKTELEKQAKKIENLIKKQQHESK